METAILDFGGKAGPCLLYTSYAPDCFYSTEALIEALQPLKNSGIPITVHMLSLIHI